LSRSNGSRSIAFPLIGAGSGGFKQDRAQALMLDELGKLNVPMVVKVVVFKRRADL
jgi:O-acetyl-ADP-ribose deacetylase (regulator of RNase III)